jgi:glycerol-3-phosphate dehydrogenase
LARVEALVIGGGATGAGVARDLALRGIEVLMLERGDFCAGASGGNHGMLHSGARYAVTDPVSARECAEEGRALRRLASFCIEDCGGMFVSLPQDDPGHTARFEKACRAAGVACQPLTVQEARAKEPGLAGDVVNAFAVEDASVDPFSLVMGNVESAREAGAKVLNYKVVQSFRVWRHRVEEVMFMDAITGEAERVKPEVVVNASGAWAGEVASLAGLRIAMSVDKGSMVVLDGRICNGLVNRLRPPSDGDIVVPNHSASILGTTSSPMARPGPVCTTREEVQSLVREASFVLPRASQARGVRAYSGIRPLLASTGRKASRGFQIIEHSSHGVENMISVIGGKLTTYRLMAERAGDAVCKVLGSSASCRTRSEPIVSDGHEDHLEGVLQIHRRRMLSKYGPTRAKVAEACARRPRGTELACSCEQVLQGELDHFASHPDVRALGDLTRRTRAGMGYCQGGLCALSLLSSLAQRTDQDPQRLLEDYLSERWKGLWPVLEGEQLRQEVMKRYLLTGTYHLRIREGAP